METEDTLIRNYAIVASSIFLLLFLTYIIIRIFRHLNKNLNVILIDFGVGFIAATLFFYKGFQLLFQFIKSTFTITHQLLTNQEKAPVDAEDVIGNFISNEGLIRVLLLITFFFMVSYFTSLVRIKYQVGKKGDLGKEIYKKRNTLLKNIFTAAIILGSIYLCITTLIAVSYFNDSDNSKYEMTTVLEQEFKKYEATDSLAKNYYIEKITEMSNLIAQDSTLKDDKGLNIYTQKVVSNIQHQFDRLEQEKNMAINLLRETDQKKLSNDYKLKYKNGIVSWYYKFRNEWKNYVSSDFNDYIKNTSAWHKNPENKADDAYFYNINVVNYNYTMNTLTKDSVNVDDDIFNVIAGWLLKSLSYHFIIIAGLLGFGFLGAVVATLVRKPKEEGQNELLLTDLLGVIVRGFSAALIVFLAVQGGLSILAREQVELNAYALFFTCFASAVYSENAWEWVKNKLITNLKSLKNEGEENETSGRKKPMQEADAFNRIDEKLAAQKELSKNNKTDYIFSIIDKQLGK